MVSIVERFLPWLDRQKDVDALRLHVSAECLLDMQHRHDHSGVEPREWKLSRCLTPSPTSGMSSDGDIFAAMNDVFQIPPPNDRVGILQRKLREGR